MTLLYETDRLYRSSPSFLLCGVDEAGRGPLAGPVVAAAVILPFDKTIEGLNDSKKLSEKKRAVLFDIILHESLAFGIGFATEQEIDEINILNASMLAMERAVKELNLIPDKILVDGNRIPKGFSVPAEALIKGDGKSASIAAASILAKVTRDRLMTVLHERYPQYDFCKHKGYPTKAHYEKIKQYGISPCHRKSFLKNLDEK